MAYLLISEDQLLDTIKLVGNENYVYKFLFDSSNKDDYHENKLGLTKLTDSLIFSDQAVTLKTLKHKKDGKDIEKTVNKIMYNLFESGHYISMINDAYVYENIVYVLTRATDDTDKALYLKTEAIREIIKQFANALFLREGFKVYDYDLFSSGMTIDDDANREYFKTVQRKISENEDNELKEELLSQFNEMFKFKVLSIYARIRYYELNDIMSILEGFGFLDDKIFDDCIIDEDEARKILSKRLAVRSLKKDIDMLIDKGIFKKDVIKYNI